MLTGSLSIWPFEKVVVPLRLGVLIVLLGLLFALLLVNLKVATLKFSYSGCALGLWLLFFSGWMDRGYSML
ncbi:MAG: hypothetical protein KDD42_02150, partial [Bdellovibrionales bacterium]|nr:hypothetical protein [Bdellovibrionales bacterium]